MGYGQQSYYGGLFYKGDSGLPARYNPSILMQLFPQGRAWAVSGPDLNVTTAILPVGPAKALRSRSPITANTGTESSITVSMMSLFPVGKAWSKSDPDQAVAGIVTELRAPKTVRARATKMPSESSALTALLCLFPVGVAWNALRD